MKNAMLVCALVCASVAGCHGATTAPANATISAIISPSNGALAQCFTVQFSAAVRDGTGAAIVPDSVKWLSKSSAGSISATGLLTGVQSTVADTIVASAFFHGLQAEAQVIFPILPSTSGHCP